MAGELPGPVAHAPLLGEARRADFGKLVAVFKAQGIQRDAAAAGLLRPSVPSVTLAPRLSEASVVELSCPNRLEVIEAALGAHQGQWRRPVT